MKVIANSKGNTEIMKYKQLAVITSVLLFQPTLQRSFVKRLAKLERLDQLKTTRINQLEKQTTDLRAEIKVLKDQLDEFLTDDPSDTTRMTPTSINPQTIEPTEKLPNAENTQGHAFTQNDLQELNTGHH